MMCYPMYFLCTCVIEYPKENVEDKIKSNEKNKEKIHTVGSSSYIYCVQICSMPHDKSIDNAIFLLKFPTCYYENKRRKKESTRCFIPCIFCVHIVS